MNLFENSYRGYGLPLTTLLIRHPSEWMKPRRRSPGCAIATVDCHSTRRMGRRCFFPDPCCGNTHGQCFHSAPTSMQPFRRIIPTRRWPTTFIAAAHSVMIPGYLRSRKILKR